MPKLHNIHPRTGFQPRAKGEPRDLRIAHLHKDSTLAEFLDLHHFGKQVWFTCPLQRRCSTTSPYTEAKFWWEPSGGLNQGLFQGFITGVRTLSSGKNIDDGGGYNISSTFPAFLVTFSPYHNPRYVLPWHIWESRRAYAEDGGSVREGRRV